MSGADGTARVLRLIARKLEEYLDGTEMAFETLGEDLERENVTADEVEAAILGIRSLAGLALPAGWVGATAGGGHRMLSSEERELLSTETWGYLHGLRANGTLDAEQLERVLETLAALGEGPVEVEQAREVAAKVALEVEAFDGGGEAGHGDQEVAH